MTALEHARAYDARGWSIFPLVPGRKTPAVELRPFLTGERRASEDMLWEWWGPQGTRPDGGIGIVCGAPSGGLVVIDVDPRNGGDVDACAGLLGPTVVTGGGGLHVYCRADGVAKGKTARPGIDRQGRGGYVVAPPSRTTGEYLWKVGTENLPLPPLPAWALERPYTSPLPDGAPMSPWVAGTLLQAERVEPGTQEETLAKLAWWAAGSLDRDIAEAVLWRWMQGLTLGNPRDPWTLEHLTQKLDGAYAKREKEFIVTSGLASSEELHRAAMRDVGAAPPPAPAPLPAAPFVPLASLEFSDQTWLVQDFLAPGCYTEVIGKVKKGKSTLVYQLIRSVLTGADFLGRAAAQAPVLLLTEQAGGSLRATLERAQLHGRDLPLVVVQKPGLSSLGPWHQAAAGVIETALWLGARLIVVDTLSRLAKVTGDRENNSSAVEILDPFDRARAAGIACLFVRHARKGQSGETDDIADAARGSSAITGDMDIVIRLRPHGESDLRVLSWESRLTDDPEDIGLKYVGGEYEVSDMPDTARQVKHREKIEEMRRMLAEGLTYTDMQLREGWRSATTIARYKKIVEEGEPLPAPPGEGA